MAAEWADGLGSERSDLELVLAARRGEAGAFDLLFYRYRDGIFRMALAVTRDPSAAEEVLVDTFARAYRHLDRLEPHDTLRPWLYRVALNLSYDQRARQRPQVGRIDEVAHEVLVRDDQLPERLAERGEEQRVVLACIDRLTFKQRVVVILHYLHDMNLAEIAQVVDCPVGTVKSRLHYALRRLRADLLADRQLEVEPIGPPAGTEVVE